jgi:hypothetical protein
MFVRRDGCLRKSAISTGTKKPKERETHEVRVIVRWYSLSAAPCRTVQISSTNDKVCATESATDSSCIKIHFLQPLTS